MKLIRSTRNPHNMTSVLPKKKKIHQSKLRNRNISHMTRIHIVIYIPVICIDTHNKCKKSEEKP